MTSSSSATSAQPPHVLFIDNFDSFTFNLVDELRRRGCSVDVWRNDITAQQALSLALALPSPRLIVLSPGPGRPEDAGCCQELITLACGQVPIFGVCLGLQAAVQALGGKVGSAGEIVHGKAVAIEHDGRGIFEGLPQPLAVGRYHSLVATELPESLEVSARYRLPTAGGAAAGGVESPSLVMAVAHRSAPLAAVQFHPESILTPQGGLLIERTLAWAAAYQK